MFYRKSLNQQIHLFFFELVSVVAFLQKLLLQYTCQQITLEYSTMKRTVSIHQHTLTYYSKTEEVWNRSRINSVGRVLDFKAGCRGCDSPAQTNTQGLKITEKLSYRLSQHCKRLDPRMVRITMAVAVPSPVEDLKIVSPISTFVLNTLTFKKAHFYFYSFRLQYEMLTKAFKLAGRLLQIVLPENHRRVSKT